MIFIHDDCSVWKEGLCKFGVGAPHIADEELYPVSYTHLDVYKRQVKGPPNDIYFIIKGPYRS